MSPGGTGTRSGQVLEDMVLPALRLGGYRVEPRYGYLKQRILGGTKRYKPDVMAWDQSGATILISLKWQQVSGSAEAKLPFEVIQLIDVIAMNMASRAYIVLGGNGWSSIKAWYLNGGLATYIPQARVVQLIGLEDFIFKANTGQL